MLVAGISGLGFSAAQVDSFGQAPSRDASCPFGDGDFVHARAKPRGMLACRWSGSSRLRPGSLAGDPIAVSPAGMARIQGQLAQS
jgi:hypothetical protein